MSSESDDSQSTFPSEEDRAEFASEFGPEAILYRVPAQNGYFNTWGAVTILPADSKEETLVNGWALARRLAAWFLARLSRRHQQTESYVLIVAWSQVVRKLQGHIFKATGDVAILKTLALSENWTQFEEIAHQRPLRPDWEKEVFESDAR